MLVPLHPLEGSWGRRNGDKKKVQAIKQLSLLIHLADF